jgi:hypothetical protein
VTPIADMIEQMLADNAPMTAILAAVRAMERVTYVTRDKALLSRVTKRDGDRKRQEKRRKRLKELKLKEATQANDGAALGVTVTRDSVTPHCDLSFLSSSIGEPLKKESKRDGLRARGTRMESGAILAEPFRQAAIELGALEGEIPNAWAEFVDYWIGVPGNRGTKLDWLATWRNRVRDTLKRGNRNGNRAANTRTTGHDAILAAATRAAGKIAGDGPMAGRGNEAEFSFGNGPERTGATGFERSHDGAGKTDDRHKPSAGGVLEGEIIPPDEAAARLSGGGRRH